MYELLLPVALMFRLEMSYFPMPFLAQASDDPARSHKGFSRALRFRWLVRTTAEHRYAGIVVKELETNGQADHPEDARTSPVWSRWKSEGVSYDK